MNNDFDSDSNSDSKNSWTVVNETIDQKKSKLSYFFTKNINDNAFLREHLILTNIIVSNRGFIATDADINAILNTINHDLKETKPSEQKMDIDYPLYQDESTYTVNNLTEIIFTFIYLNFKDVDIDKINWCDILRYYAVINASNLPSHSYLKETLYEYKTSNYFSSLNECFTTFNRSEKNQKLDLELRGHLLALIQTDIEKKKHAQLPIEQNLPLQDEKNQAAFSIPDEIPDEISEKTSSLHLSMLTMEFNDNFNAPETENYAFLLYYSQLLLGLGLALLIVFVLTLPPIASPLGITSVLGSELTHGLCLIAAGASTSLLVTAGFLPWPLGHSQTLINLLAKNCQLCSKR